MGFAAEGHRRRKKGQRGSHESGTVHDPRQRDAEHGPQNDRRVDRHNQVSRMANTAQRSSRASKPDSARTAPCSIRSCIIVISPYDPTHPPRVGIEYRPRWT